MPGFGIPGIGSLRSGGILCFGDSLTEGYGVGHDESYPYFLQQRLREQGHSLRVINAGISGETTGDALQRLKKAIRTQPDFAIIALGANDAFLGVPHAIMEGNLAEIIVAFQQAGSRVILGGLAIPAIFGVRDPQQFAAIFPQLAMRYGIALVPDFLAGVPGQRRYNLLDGFHPNGAGYALIMENVWSVLQPLLPVPS
ncbi:MAG: arylesterase [Magnetococcus sp. DMHC-1]|nr:arylesterase [Magnetococcales bacterium]